jgi:hypothetical protein
MNALPDPGTAQVDASSGASAEPPPRFGGMLRRLVRPQPTCSAAHGQVTQTLGQPRVLLLDSCGSHVQIRSGANYCANECLRGKWARSFAIRSRHRPASYQ